MERGTIKELQRKLMVQTNETLRLVEDVEQLKREHKKLIKTMLYIKHLVQDSTGDMELIEEINRIIDEVVK